MKKAAITWALVYFLIISFIPCSLAQNPDQAAALAAKLQTSQAEISDYNTACYFALSGNKKMALAYLTKAIKDGFNAS